MNKQEEQDAFKTWSAAFMIEASFQGTKIADLDERIERVQALWNAPIASSLIREHDDELWTGCRYRRGDSGDPNPGEGKMEHGILVEHFDEVRCLGGELVDGMNAVPLARSVNGVQADMLLLAKIDSRYRLVLVEAKVSDRNAWYAVIENLRQLALLNASYNLRRVFHRREPGLGLPDDLPTTGIVLAPASYYAAPGQKSESVAPARRLIEALGVDVRLAVWEAPRRAIELLN